MQTVLETNNPADFYLNLYKRSEEGPTWLKDWRGVIFSRFQQFGFPSVEAEAWRMNPLQFLLDLPFHPSQVTSHQETLFEQLKPCFYAFDPEIKVVFLNGKFAKQFSTIPTVNGIELLPLAEILRGSKKFEDSLKTFPQIWGNGFTDLNSLFFEDGVYLRILKETTVELPIHIYYFSLAPGEERTVSYPRSLFILENGSKARVVESFIELGSGEHFSNGITQIQVGEECAFEYGRIHHGRLVSCALGSIDASVGRGSDFTSHAVSLGGKFVRNDLKVSLDGEGSECLLNGLYLGMGEEFADHHTVIEHNRSHSSSRELYKGILGGKSRAVFNGSIVVAKGAQKTDALQSNKNLLLSDKARIFTKPQLQIFANDVKCKHGATIGQLDSDLLFYLRSRGINLDEARKLLIHAFASEIIDRISLGSLREALTRLLFSRLMEAKHGG